MTKFMRNCAISALIMIVAGLVLSLSACAIKGTEAMSEAVSEMSDGRLNLNLGNEDGWGLTWDDTSLGEILEENTEIHFDISDNSVFDSHHSVESGDVQKEFAGADIDELKIEVGGCEMKIEDSSDNVVRIKAENTKKFQSYVEDGCLYVRAVRSGNFNASESNRCEIVLSVPRDLAFDMAEIDLGAGKLELCRITAKKLAIEVGAGQLTGEKLTADSAQIEIGAGGIRIEEMDFGSVEAEVGMGNLELNGDVSKDLDVVCAMGNVDIRLNGSESDYNYRIEGAVGNVDIGDTGYKGIAQERTIDNGASRTITVECSMGNLSVQFEK